MESSLPVRGTLVAAVVALHLVACPSEKSTDRPKAENEWVPVAAPQPVQPATAMPAAGENDEGKRLYLTGCATCHGMDGSGSMMRQVLPNIGDLTSADTHKRLSDSDIAERIAKGKDKMPPFESVFKPDQIKAIVAYVRTLKKG